MLSQPVAVLGSAGAIKSIQCGCTPRRLNCRLRTAVLRTAFSCLIGDHEDDPLPPSQDAELVMLGSERFLLIAKEDEPGYVRFVKVSP